MAWDEMDGGSSGDGRVGHKAGKMHAALYKEIKKKEAKRQKKETHAVKHTSLIIRHPLSSEVIEADVGIVHAEAVE